MKNPYLFILTALLVILVGCSDNNGTDNNDDVDSDTGSEISDSDTTDSDTDESTDETDTGPLQPCAENFQQPTVLLAPDDTQNFISGMAVTENGIFYSYSSGNIYKMNNATDTPVLFIETTGGLPYLGEDDEYIYWYQKDENVLKRFPIDTADGTSELVLENYEGGVTRGFFGVDEIAGTVYFSYRNSATWDNLLARRQIGDTDPPAELYDTINMPGMVLDGSTLYVLYGGLFDGGILEVNTEDLTETSLLEETEIEGFTYRDGLFAFTSWGNPLMTMDASTQTLTELLAPEGDLNQLKLTTERVYWYNGDYLGWSSLDGTQCELIFETNDDQWTGLQTLRITQEGVLFSFATIMENGFYFVPHS